MRKHFFYYCLLFGANQHHLSPDFFIWRILVCKHYRIWFSPVLISNLLPVFSCSYLQIDYFTIIVKEKPYKIFNKSSHIIIELNLQKIFSSNNHPNPPHHCTIFCTIYYTFCKVPHQSMDGPIISKTSWCI